MHAFVTIDSHAAQPALCHVAHDLHGKPGRRLRALRPCRVPHAHWLEVVRHATHHDSLVEVDTRHIDGRAIDREREFQEVELKAGREHADVALNALTAFQHHAIGCEALYLARLHRHPAGLDRFLEADGDRNTLLPWTITGSEVLAQRLVADGVPPMVAEDLARESRKGAEHDEDHVVARLKVA